MDNETTGLAAYVAQQISAATGDGVSGSDPIDAVADAPAEQEAVAPPSADANDALSGDGVAPEDETALALDSEVETVPAAADVTAELDRLRAEKAERDRKDAEALAAQQRAEAARRQQETIAYFERQFAALDEIDDGLGARVKTIAAQIASVAIEEQKAELDALRQQADGHGRVASAVLQVMQQSDKPLTWDEVKPMAQALMALNSPAEQAQYLDLVKQQAAKATAARDRENAALKAQITKLTKQLTARNLANDDALAVGSGGMGAVSGTPATDEPTDLTSYMARQMQSARQMAGVR